MNEDIVGTIDVAEMAFYAFVLFFIVLVYYLRREDRREGYPLEDELSGRVEIPDGVLLMAAPKTFHLPHGRGTVSVPRPRTEDREPVRIAARRRENFHGAPYHPTGNPLADGVGPAAYAERARVPDLDAVGRNRIVPLSSDPHFYIAPASPDPRGMAVYGADGRRAGTVVDVWVDRSEVTIRYLTVDTGTNLVVAPMAMASVERRGIVIDAINAADFAAAPVPANPLEITRYEEERVIGYFGGGYLYANADRQEPLL